MKIKNKLLIGLIFFLGGIIITMFLIAPIRAQITQVMGLAVAQTPLRWNNMKDAAAGDNLTNGIGVFSPYLFDGTNFDAARGDATSGLWVNVKSSAGTSGTAFYSIKRVDIAAVSQNLAFGFTSKKVIIETPPSNTDEVVIDWIGGAAVAPAANTAGDDRILPGRMITLDDYAVTSISVIAASGTQTIYVRAWN